MSRNVYSPLGEVASLSPSSQELLRQLELAFFRDRFSQYCQLDFSDEESGVSRSSNSAFLGSEDKNNVNLVTWDGPEDPHNPKNWRQWRKWATTLIISAFAFTSSLSSSMATPALDNIGRELHIQSGIQTQIAVSIFVLAYSFGPFIVSPISEIWGRTRIIQIGSLVFLIFNTVCGFAQTRAELTAFRFVSGLLGSPTLGMGGAIISDCWRTEERGKSMGLYQLAQVLGPTIGPIIGGYISQRTTWRWTFWSISCFSFLIQIIGVFCLEESYAPRILFLKAKKLRKETDDPKLQTQWEREGAIIPTILRASLLRPWILLGTQPIIQVLALYQAYNFGLMYVLILSFPSLWEGQYGMRPSIASLNYLSLALGSFIGSQICGPLTDTIHRRLKKHYGYAEDAYGLPEFRIPLMIPAAFVTPCGIFLYGWSARARLHWIFPNLGAGMFACGSMISYQSIQTYIVDAYPRYAASASAASAFLRSLAAFTFPLFAHYLFHDVGYGWGCSVLGLAAVVLGIPAPLVFWRYGEALRKRSAFASGI